MVISLYNNNNIISKSETLYLKDVIDNNYVLDIILGICLFSYIYYLMINKGLKKAVAYTGLGTVDKIFGFFFGFIKGHM